MTVAPFGGGIRYLIEQRPRGKKLAPRSAPGVAVGCGTAKALWILDLRSLDLQGFVADQAVKVVTMRDFRFAPGEATPFSIPFVQVAGSQSLQQDWSFEIEAVPAVADARGAVPVCALCGRPIADEEDRADPCPAYVAEQGRRAKLKTDVATHVDGSRCLRFFRCMCDEMLEGLLPDLELAPPAEDAGEASIPEGCVDYPGMYRDRLGAEARAADYDVPALAIVTRL